MRYRNVRTGTVVNVASRVVGEAWEELPALPQAPAGGDAPKDSKAAAAGSAPKKASRARGKP